MRQTTKTLPQEDLHTSAGNQPVLFFCLYKETDWTKSVITAQQGAMRILHPTIEEIATSLGKFFHIAAHCLPRLFTKPFGLLGTNALPHHALAHVTSMLDRILQQGLQVLVVCLAQRRYSYFLHIIDTINRPPTQLLPPTSNPFTHPM